MTASAASSGGTITGAFDSSEYTLSTITLIASDGNAVDITDLVLELNIHEDLFSPVMTGSVLVGDGIDMIVTMHLQGNEFIVLNVDKPALGRPINRSFRVYKIGERELGVNTLQNYVIYFCSEELILSAQNIISKSYKGLRTDQMVNDILVNKLKVHPNKLANGAFEQTGGNFDYILPRLQPFEAIEWLRARSYNTNRNLWLFFENRDGFNFVSYESLNQIPIYCTYYRNLKLDVEPPKNLNSFNYIKVIHDFDILKGTRVGSFSSSLLTYDIINRTQNFYNFNATQFMKTSLNKHISINELQNRLGQSVTTNQFSMVKYYMMNDSDPTRNPVMVEKWLAQNALRLGLLHGLKIVIVVPGDVLLKVGMIIELVIPKMAPQGPTVANDGFKSGKYMISAVHHKFVQNQYNCILECLSDSRSRSLQAAVQSSPTIQQIIKS